MLELRDELEAHNVTLLIATMPQTSFDTAIGRYVFLQLCGAAQLQRDLDSERMSAMTKSLFLDGRHRGDDPFGYRSARDERGALERPRQLEVVPDEAEVVRLVFQKAATASTSAIAQELNAEGVLRRPKAVRQPDGSVTYEHQPWTRDAVKDILRRGRFYLGFVVEKRGLDERPGHHEAIIDEATYNAALIGARTRFQSRRAPEAASPVSAQGGHRLRERAPDARRLRGVAWAGVALLPSAGSATHAVGPGGCSRAVVVDAIRR